MIIIYSYITNTRYFLIAPLLFCFVLFVIFLVVDLPPVNNTPTATVESSTTSSNGTEGDWVGTDIAPATDAISNFSIGDDEDDDADLLL